VVHLSSLKCSCAARILTSLCSASGLASELVAAHCGLDPVDSGVE
jgi:hypothetical protein